MFSVIIPTLNEEKYIGRLLISIKEQNLQPAEIIVANSKKSTDNTRKIAEKFGCTIVEGGSPAEGRNNGAKAATQDILVFLDADTELLSKKTFSKMIGTFIAKEADVASCYARNIKEENSLPSSSHIAFNTTKRINKLTTKVFNDVVGELGFSIIVRKTFFNEIDGFNEEQYMWEDSEFFKRALKHGGSYYVIPVHIGVSDRRFDTRDPLSTIKISAMVIAMGVGMFLGIKEWKKILDRYEKEKGQLGGKKATQGE